MKSSSNSILVGVFSLGALSLLLGFTIFTGGFSSIGSRNERFVLVFHENMYGLYEGGKVTLNGVRIGRVERFFLGDAIEDGPVPVLIEINRKLVLRHMVEDGNEIFDQDGLFKKEIIPSLVGQLIQESFVTGILYVNLVTDELSDQADLSEPMLYGHRELRTKASIFAELSESINLDKLSKQISKLMEVATGRLEELDFGVLVRDFSETNKVLQGFIGNFSEAYLGLGPSLLKTSEESRVALSKVSGLAKQLETVVAPDSDFRFEMETTLREVSTMAKSLKKLADLLERNPQAIIRGKPTKDE